MQRWLKLLCWLISLSILINKNYCVIIVLSTENLCSFLNLERLLTREQSKISLAFFDSGLLGLDVRKISGMVNFWLILTAQRHLLKVMIILKVTDISHILINTKDLYYIFFKLNLEFYHLFVDPFILPLEGAAVHIFLIRWCKIVLHSVIYKFLYSFGTKSNPRVI